MAEYQPELLSQDAFTRCSNLLEFRETEWPHLPEYMTFGLAVFIYYMKPVRKRW